MAAIAQRYKVSNGWTGSAAADELAKPSQRLNTRRPLFGNTLSVDGSTIATFIGLGVISMGARDRLQ